MDSQQQYRRLSLPTGTETLQLREAARHHRITRTLEDLFSQWGYEPAETPIVDYFDVYRRLLDDTDVRQVYRAVDRQGDILALRSDTTLFLAKQLGLHLSENDLPVRVFYNDQIVRAEDRHNISNNEYQQAGIEIVGVPGSEGDVEALLLAAEALAALGLDEAVLHVGSHGLIRACAAVAGVSEDGLAQAVRGRNLDSLPASTAREQAVRSIAGFVGTVGEFRAYLAATRDLDARIQDAADQLLRTVEQLAAVCRPDFSGRIRIDLSELGAYGYYSGVAFGAYVPDANAAILRGGRYDRLLAAFGFDAPSVGFSVFTRKLPDHVLASESNVAATPASAAPVEGGDLGDRVRRAREEHSQGRRIRLS